MKRVLLIAGIVIAIAGSAQPTLSFVTDHTLTPNTTDTLGVFSRVFYHPSRNKFYCVYAARPAGSTLPTRQMTNFAWREYDANFNFTGNSGSLPGFTSAGDYAMVMEDSTYYHLTTAPGANYKLSKFNDNFASQGNTTITLDLHDSNTDQLMGFGNDRLIIGAFNEQTQTHPSFPMQPAWTPHMHLFQYDTASLTPVTSDVYLSPTFYSWGGSALYNSNNNHYEVVSLDSFPTYQLYAYEYDQNWNYLSQHLLSTDGQWSQGFLFDGTYYYLAYHSGHEHRCGNIVVAIFDQNWNLQDSLTITNYPAFPPTLGSHANAQRPFLCKVGLELYVGYDVETYTYNGGNNIMTDFNWQAHVSQVHINPVMSVEENPTLNAVTIYPVPTDGKLHVNISSNEQVDVLVTDAEGNSVLSEQISNDVMLDMSDKAAGIYFVRLTSEDGFPVTKKIVKY